MPRVCSQGTGKMKSFSRTPVRVGRDGRPINTSIHDSSSSIAERSIRFLLLTIPNHRSKLRRPLVSSCPQTRRKKRKYCHCSLARPAQVEHLFSTAGEPTLAPTLRRVMGELFGCFLGNGLPAPRPWPFFYSAIIIQPFPRVQRC